LRLKGLYSAACSGEEGNRDAGGDLHIWLDPRVLDRLKALRGPGESYSDVILRLAKARRG
jgi:hypothetical protein